MPEAKETQGQVLLLATGGTIAGQGAAGGNPLEYTAGQVAVDDLAASIPERERVLAGRELHLQTVAAMDSKDMDHATWQQLLAACLTGLSDPGVQSIVITHGTDTLEETAWFLRQCLPPIKPVILTCAMRPATAQAPDGPANLRDALAVSLDPRSCGVWLVCAGEVHAPERLSKVHPQRLDAFSSGESGPAGFVGPQGLLSLQVSTDDWPVPPLPWPELAARLLSTPVKAWPAVAIWISHAGMDAAWLRALMTVPLDGLVLACTGNGTVHQAIESVLDEAPAIRVVRSSRCVLGRVISSPESRWPDSKGLNPGKARVQLMLELLAAR